MGRVANAGHETQLCQKPLIEESNTCVIMMKHPQLQYCSDFNVYKIDFDDITCITLHLSDTKWKVSAVEVEK